MRLFPHVGAYRLTWSLRALMPRRSRWRVAQFDTIRLRLVKLAVRIEVLKMQVRLHLPGARRVRPAADANALPEHLKPRQIARPIRSTPTPSSCQTDKNGPNRSRWQAMRSQLPVVSSSHHQSCGTALMNYLG